MHLKQNAVSRRDLQNPYTQHFEEIYAYIYTQEKDLVELFT